MHVSRDDTVKAGSNSGAGGTRMDEGGPMERLLLCFLSRLQCSTATGAVDTVGIERNREATAAPAGREPQ